MEDLEKYLKYYFLEDYLFGSVSKNFQKNGYLAPEEFFAIVIWKRNASKSKIIEGVKESGETIKSLTQKIYKLTNRRDKLITLINIRNIGIAIASAILTVLSPDEFTIIDYRVKNSLKRLNIKFPDKIEENVESYFQYVDICKETAQKWDLSLRNFDRALWAMDFYKGKNGLKDITKGLN